MVPLCCSQGTGLPDGPLDVCHGQTLADGRYAYIAVQDDFPYVLGCFRARPDSNQNTQCNDGKYRNGNGNVVLTKLSSLAANDSCRCSQ